jgi:hypothetical protein
VTQSDVQQINRLFTHTIARARIDNVIICAKATHSSTDTASGPGVELLKVTYLMQCAGEGRPGWVEVRTAVLDLVHGAEGRGPSSRGIGKRRVTRQILSDYPAYTQFSARGCRPPPDLSDPSHGPAPWPQGHAHGPSRRNGPRCDAGVGTVRIAARARFDRRPALQ